VSAPSIDGYEPTFDDNGVGLCVETCQQYDGKRCQLMGFRPGRICEPWAIDAAKAVGPERAQLLERVKEDNAFCLCGCPISDHENYGEDGESCGDGDHECIRTCAAIAGLFAENARKLQEHEELKKALKECVNIIEHLMPLKSHFGPCIGELSGCDGECLARASLMEVLLRAEVLAKVEGE
jgi:hypothetical protein